MNTFGKNFVVSLFGESHGEAIGVVMDGVPAGMPLCVEDFDFDIKRRKSGGKGTTPRIEADEPVILSGVYEGNTTGAPLAILFKNTNTRSADYEILQQVPRPGHADFVADVKFDSFNDPRGGGHFSGRLTLPIVAAGVVAKKTIASVLENDSDPSPCTIKAKIVELGGIPCGGNAEKKWREALDAATAEGDSLGAVVECVISEVPVGLGEPFFNSLESCISHAVFAIPGVRGIEFGDGFRAAAMKGSEHNDPFGPDGRPVKNGAGGINGGISNGENIVFRVAFKPTSSIAKEQKTLNFITDKMTALSVPGRHDVCFALRAPVIVEAMAALVLADQLV
ncbi:MAG: chorismate synthase [Bacteroidales bacterium]|nr:chorismate synthase [Bacteroidales bacterium]